MACTLSSTTCSRPRRPATALLMLSSKARKLAKYRLALTRRLGNRGLTGTAWRCRLRKCSVPATGPASAVCDYDPKSDRTQHASADDVIDYVHTHHLKDMQKVFKGVFNLEPGETRFGEDPRRYPPLWAGCSEAGLTSHHGLM